MRVNNPPIFYFFYVILLLLISACADEKGGDNEKIAPLSYQARLIDPDFKGINQNPYTGDYIAWASDGIIQVSAQGKTWQQANVPVSASGVTINQLVYQQPVSKNSPIIAVGEQGLLLYSTNGGYDWQNSHLDGEFKGDIHDAIFLQEQGTWLAVADSGVLLHSRDNGVSWRIEETGRKENLLVVRQLQDAKTIVIGAENGLLAISVDGAKSWRLVETKTEAPITDIVQFEHLLMGTSAWGRVLLSTDIAQSWRLLQTQSRSDYLSVVRDLAHDTIVLAGHDGKILLNKNFSDKWDQVEVYHNKQRVFLSEMFYDEKLKRLIAFANNGVALSSSDGGKQWISLHSPFRESFKHVYHDKKKNRFIAVGERGFKANYDNSLQQWQTITRAKDYYWREVKETPNGDLLIAGELGKILYSDSVGERWSYLDIDYPDKNSPPTYRALMVYHKENTLLAAGPTGLILQSNNAGIDWRVVHHTPFYDGEAFTCLARNTSQTIVVAVEAFGGPYISFDKGNSWLRGKINKDSRNLWHASLLERKNDTLALVVGQAGFVMTAVIKNTDDVPAWKDAKLAITQDLFGSFALQESQRLFAFGVQGQLWLAEGEPLVWRDKHLPTQARLQKMIMEPKKNNLLVFGSRGVIFLSDDRGESWKAIDSGVTSELRVASIDNKTGSIFLAGRDGVMLRSVDAGLHWEKMDTHTTSHFRSMVVHQDSGKLVAVGEKIVVLEPRVEHGS